MIFAVISPIFSFDFGLFGHFCSPFKAGLMLLMGCGLYMFREAIMISSTTVPTAAI